VPPHANPDFTALSRQQKNESLHGWHWQQQQQQLYQFNAFPVGRRVLMTQAVSCDGGGGTERSLHGVTKYERWTATMRAILNDARHVLIGFSGVCIHA